MRVTDVAAGGSAVPMASAQAASPPQAQDARPASAPAAEASGLAASVLRACGDFYRAVDGAAPVLDDLPLPIPQLVVVGHEGSGKSSVLESVAMLSVFPRDSAMCTRLPILLKLRHTSHVAVAGDPELMPHHRAALQQPQQTVAMRLVYADGRAPVTSVGSLSPEQAAPLLRQWMDQIVAEQHELQQLRGVAEHVLEIELRSPDVPTLNLLDLPGIVAGRLIDEPDDMMQRTRAIVEKYLQVPHTLVLAVVPASERVRNSQALQLVQQYNLVDRTVGVLTMVDRAVDDTNPDGPLAEVTSRLDGTSSDIVFLKQGYVAVKNRDSRAKTEVSLEQAKLEEKAWLEENLPGYIGRGLASSVVLSAKLEQMVADHVRTLWVPLAQAKIEQERKRAEKKLASLGPDAQNIVNDFLGVYPTTARKRMLELLKPILPELLSHVDEEMLRLAALVHTDFLKSREEHELIMAPFQAMKKLNAFSASSGSLVAASMLMLDSHSTYIANHLVQILKNVVLHLVGLIQRTLETKDSMPLRLDRFGNLHFFFAGVLWEQLNELLIGEEELLHRIKKSFLEFDPENSSILQLPARIKMTSSTGANELKNLASSLEVYLDSKGFQNTSLDEVYLPLVSSSVVSMTRDMSRLILSAEIPTLPKSRSRGFGDVKSAPEQVVLEFPLQTVTKDYCTLDAMAAGCFAPNIKPNGEEVIKAASYMDQMRLDVAASEFYTAT
ncbi:Dynamin domain containing protein [Phytophthora cinnamomi]|uniref:Dynamin domain containing protein n=1 Tax=Phytophthora cinnamomi TaxID=4785 RepID=UPI00355ABA51|nr:Dynamin domain containing protein [Phytophthora cinnamomi]